MPESVVEIRRNWRGTPFHTGPFTQKARVCVIVVWAHGTERIPSPLRVGNDLQQFTIRYRAQILCRLMYLTGHS